MSIQSGAFLGAYEVVARLGAGGMGEVWRARDPRLEREVALKLLPAAGADEAARSRLLREARLASKLNHPNVCTIYEVGESDGEAYIAMELVEGESLAARLAGGGLPSEQVLRYGQQVADALEHAHGRGVVHRDLKPANVVITPEGRAKVLDFGVAGRLSDGELTEATTRSAESMRLEGKIAGTLPYMAPEQLRGHGADARSDIWALGVMLYEMAAGERPFQGGTAFELSSAILSRPVPPLVERAAGSVPRRLQSVIERCLEKDPAARFQHAAEVRTELQRAEPATILPRFVRCLHAAGGRRRALTDRIAGLGWRRVLAGAVAVTGAAIGLVLWQGHAGELRWAREKALPEIEALADENRFFAAYLLALEADRIIPRDPKLEELWQRISRRVDVLTEPEGADLFISSYEGEENLSLGHSPLRQVRVPLVDRRWKIAKPGFVTMEGLWQQGGGPIHLRLDEVGEAPAGMIRVTGGEFVLDMPHLGPQAGVTLSDYWIDTYEVTNRAYQDFVDAGGYSNPDLWRHPIVDEGEVLSLPQAVERFCDRTGRPGPATWEAGTYPEGQADYPVGGVSWYEAAAYAEFVGKSLPTIFHWVRAAGLNQTDLIVPHSNFAGQGPANVGQYGGLSDVGAYDMAGNVKEWCLNANGSRRFTLGGAWDEQKYMFSEPDALPPIFRAGTQGFRLVRYTTEPPEAQLRQIDYPRRDYSVETPVSDEAFAVIRGLYVHDDSPLSASLEAVDDSSEFWRKETVSLDAGYGGERVIAHVFLPRGRTPPYQVLVTFLGSSGIRLRSSADLKPHLNGALVKNGRAFVIPVYKATYERGDELHTDYPAETVLYRDHVVFWYRDLARVLDYVEERPDLDASRVAYYGFSWGARMGPLFLAVEPRLRTGILMHGGLKFARSFPECDPFNFAPRVTVPVLMVNAKDDFYFPLETSQLPLFALLGSAAEDKRHVIIESPHGLVPVGPVAKEVMAWLDRYLGPVNP